MKSIIPYLGWLVAALLVSLLLWLAWLGVMYGLYPGDQNYPQLMKDAAALRGQFGDMFGGLNALLTSALFTVAFATLILQYLDSRAMRIQQQHDLLLARRAAQRETLAAVIAARASILGLRYPMQQDIEADIDKEPLLDCDAKRSLLHIRDENRKKIGSEFSAMNRSAEQLEALSAQILTELE